MSASHGAGPQVTPLYIPHQVLPFTEGLDLTAANLGSTRMLLGGPLWESMPTV